MIKRFGFDKHQRLLTAKQFTAVFQQAKRYPLSTGLYLVMPNEHNQARLGLVVAKKHLAKAVQRNWLKRCQREGFRLQQAALPGCDIVFLATGRVAKLSRRQMQVCCEQDWRQLSALLSRSAAV